MCLFPTPPSLPPSSVSASDVPGQLGGGHDPHRGRLHLAQEEDVAGDGDPGSLPALHGVHPEGLPLLPQTHPPGAFREGHRRRLPLRPPRWTRRLVDIDVFTNAVVRIQPHTLFRCGGSNFGILILKSVSAGGR